MSKKSPQANAINIMLINMIQAVTTYSELDKKISRIKDNKIKGDLFEHFCKLYFTKYFLYCEKIKNYYMYNEIPSQIRAKLNLPKTDKGIDGIIEYNDGTYDAVQVKFRSRHEILPWGEVATFPGLAFGSNVTGLRKGIMFTNCNDVCNELQDDKYINITYSDLNKLPKEFFRSIEKNIIIKPKAKIPKPHQILILDRLKNFYKDNDMGRLYAPCGCGKTYLGYQYCMNSDYKNVVIVVPSLLLLSAIYEAWTTEMYINEYKYDFLLVGSQHYVDDKGKEHEDKINYITHNVTTKKDIINKFLQNKENKKIVIVTYSSSNLLIESCKENNFKFDMKILDEVHRTCGQEGKRFTKIVTADISTKTLSMTATERIYKSKSKTDKSDMILSMDDETKYGKLIHKYSLRAAINDRQLCDYDIIASLIIDKKIKSEIDKNQFVKSDDDKQFSSHHLIIANIIIKSIEQYKLKHILVFLNKNETAKSIHLAIEAVLKNHPLNETYKNIYNGCLSGHDSMRKRQTEIRNFEESEIGIITSARIFNEGIDIQICDTIVFADSKHSTVDIIQCIGRCLRLCEQIANKKGHIIIPIILDSDIEQFFKITNKNFTKIRRILKALATTDDQVQDKFSIRDIVNKPVEDQKDTDKADHVETKNNDELTLKDFEEQIKLQIFSGVDGVAAMTCSRATEIIKKYNITTKEEYYELCEKDIRLPKDPQKSFDDFGGWVKYLSIDRSLYYEHHQLCKKSIDKIIAKNPKIMYYDLGSIYEFCKEYDDKLPPYPTDFYKDNGLRDIKQLIEIDHNLD